MTYVIACLTCHDDATKAAYPYFKELVNELEKRGYKLIKCLERNATIECVLHGFTESAREFVVFIGMGHGKPSYFMGWENQIILQVCKEPEAALRKNVVYLVYSCWTGARLGEDVVEKGAGAYIGWKKPAIVGTGEWAIFQKVAVKCFLKYLTEDITTGELYKLIKDEYVKASEEFSYDPFIADKLLYMAENVVLHGDPNIVVPKPKPRPRPPEVKPPVKPMPPQIPIAKSIEYLTYEMNLLDRLSQTIVNVIHALVIQPGVVPPWIPDWVKTLLSKLRIYVVLNNTLLDITKNFRFHRVLLNVEKTVKLGEEVDRKRVDLVVIGWEAFPKGDLDYLDVIARCEYVKDRNEIHCLFTSLIEHVVKIVVSNVEITIPQITRVGVVEPGRVYIVLKYLKK